MLQSRFGLASITDMATGAVVDQMVLDQQAADAAAALAAQQTTVAKPSFNPLLLIALAGGAYWLYARKRKGLTSGIL